MKRFVKHDAHIFKDTETDENYYIYSKNQSQFVEMAEDVSQGLNLVMSLKLRRGSPALMSLGEFKALHAGFLAAKRTMPDNPLIRDVLRICELVAGSRLEFGE